MFVAGLPLDGTLVFRPSVILPDGLLRQKFGWYREKGLHGRLIIAGKRLDAAAPPLRAEIANGYSDTGFQPSEIIFPTEGCWQVTGTVGNVSVTFVTRVMKLPGTQS